MVTSQSDSKMKHVPETETEKTNKPRRLIDTTESNETNWDDLLL
jgi:hypothetical protein